MEESGRVRRGYSAPPVGGAHSERDDDTLERVLGAAGFVPSPRGLVRYG